MSDVAIGLTLLNDLPTKIQKQCIETLIKIFRNINSNPDDPKYRSLKLSNKRFKEEVWEYEGAQMILFAAGWETFEEKIQLPSNVDISRVLKTLVDHRNVKPAAAEWVEENKMIGLSPARIKEEELKTAALECKKKDMAKLKKDMAERKEIAERILREHRHDLEVRRATGPSRATPLGSGTCAKMSEQINSSKG